MFSTVALVEWSILRNVYFSLWCWLTPSWFEKLLCDAGHYWLRECLRRNSISSRLTFTLDPYQGTINHWEAGRRNDTHKKNKKMFWDQTGLHSMSPDPTSNNYECEDKEKAIGWLLCCSSLCLTFRLKIKQLESCLKVSDRCYNPTSFSLLNTLCLRCKPQEWW